MIIRFTKGRNKPDMLTCLRDDGSCTWSPLANGFGVQHDLMHYAVESALGCREAFFGLVAQGRDTDTFGTRHGQKDRYPTEARQVEGIVGLLQFPQMSGHPLSDTDFLTTLAQFCTQNDLPAPSISHAQLTAIRTAAAALWEAWRQVPEGESMNFTFSLRAQPDAQQPLFG